MSLVRWKAMKLDREEAEEEVYMPTDKVFVMLYLSSLIMIL